jgi:hypothetical protein
MGRNQRELTEFRALVVQLSGAEDSASSAYIGLIFAMVREISKTEEEVERAVREQRQTRREVDPERRGIRQSLDADEDEKDGAGVDRVRNNLSRIDDRKDLNDDKADTKDLETRLRVQKTAVNEF